MDAANFLVLAGLEEHSTGYPKFAAAPIAADARGYWSHNRE
jgi:hypothetical protein